MSDLWRKTQLRHIGKGARMCEKKNDIRENFNPRTVQFQRIPRVNYKCEGLTKRQN